MVEQAAQRTQEQGVTGGQLALWLGLLAAIVALTTAMGQIERGANRIYGIERDRPALRKYGRALLMALTAGLLLQLGFLVIIAGDALGESLAADVRSWATRSRRCGRSAAGRSESCWRGRLSPSSSSARRAGSSRAIPGWPLARGVACAVAAVDRIVRALRRQERRVRQYVRTLDGDLRPAAVGEPVLGRALPRCRVRRAARGGAGRRSRSRHPGIRWTRT